MQRGSWLLAAMLTVACSGKATQEHQQATGGAAGRPSGSGGGGVAGAMTPLSGGRIGTGGLDTGGGWTGGTGAGGLTGGSGTGGLPGASGWGPGGGARVGGTGGGAATGGHSGGRGEATGGTTNTGGHLLGGTAGSSGIATGDGVAGGGSQHGEGGRSGSGGTGGAGGTGTGGTPHTSSCGNPVTWTLEGTDQPSINIPTADDRYRFQSNGTNLGAGSHEISLLGSCGFSVDSQTCNQSGSVPCSFPSIYVGTDADGARTSGFSPLQISSLTSVPTCLDWNPGSTGADDEYNVSYDIWFADDPNATSAQMRLQIWLRDPPEHQPASEFPIQDGVLAGNMVWTVWFAPDAMDGNVISYVVPGRELAAGRPFEFDAKDFIDEAVERGILSSDLYLIAVMAGFRIWGGAAGARMDSFRAQVQ